MIDRYDEPAEESGAMPASEVRARYLREVAIIARASRPVDEAQEAHRRDAAEAEKRERALQWAGFVARRGSVGT